MEISLVVFDILFCNSVTIFEVAAILFFMFLRSVWANSDENGFDFPLWDFKRFYFLLKDKKFKTPVF